MANQRTLIAGIFGGIVSAIFFFLIADSSTGGDFVVSNEGIQIDTWVGYAMYLATIAIVAFNYLVFQAIIVGGVEGAWENRNRTNTQIFLDNPVALWSSILTAVYIAFLVEIDVGEWSINPFFLILSALGASWINVVVQIVIEGEC